MRKRVLFLLLLAFALAPHAASGDPLRITGGAFLLDIEGDLFTFRGSGFTVTTAEADGRTNLYPDGLGIYSTKLFPGRCQPSASPFGFCGESGGALADWSFQTTGGAQLLGRGDAVFEGMTARHVDLMGSMRFDVVPTPLSPNESGDFDFVAPFSFEATIRGVQDGQELFARQFFGRGRVSVNYEGTLTPGIFAAADETIVYEFDAAPVPEPGTLLLLGSGLTLVLRRRACRRLESAAARLP